MKNATSGRLAQKSGKYFLAFCCLITSQLYAQSTSVEDLPFYLKELSHPFSATCTEEESEFRATCSCFTDEKADKTKNSGPEERIVLKITSLDQLPLHLKDSIHLENPELVSKQNPLYFSFSHSNDNFPGLKGLDTLGLSGTVSFELGGVTSRNGKSFAWGGYLYSALYSNRVIPILSHSRPTVYRDFNNDWKNIYDNLIKGSEFVDENPKKTQYIKNEENTVMGFYVNNKPAGHLLYWNSEAGFAATDKNKGLLILPGQKFWHELIGAAKYRTVEDGSDREYSAYLKGFVGLQKTLFDKKHCSINVSSQGGFIFDTSGRRRFALADFSSDIGFIDSKKGDHKILGLESKTRFQTGTDKMRAQSSTSASVSIDVSPVKFKVGFTKPLVKNYSEEFSTNYNFAQTTGHFKVIYTIPGKKK